MKLKKSSNFLKSPLWMKKSLGSLQVRSKMMYAEKNYHRTTVTPELRPTERGARYSIFKICDGPRATVKTSIFRRQYLYPVSCITKMIFTPRGMALGFMNKAGTYKPEMLDVDKFIIENYYQSNGYLAARAVDVEVVASWMKQPKMLPLPITLRGLSLPLPRYPPQETIFLRKSNFSRFFLFRRDSSTLRTLFANR